MKLRIQKSLLQHAIDHRNGYLVLACFSLLLNIVLGVGLLLTTGKEKILLVPPQIQQPLGIYHNTTSPEYLSAISHFLITLRFNLTPANIESQREILLRYVSPEYYSALKIELLNEAERMTKEHITTAFYPIDIKINSARLEALVTGDLITMVGVNQLPVKRMVYKISYTYNNYRILLKQLREVETHA
jgi:conjugal transfer pilus assembly protein TraE